MEKLRVADEGAIRTIVLSNPARRNAIGPQMVDELAEALAESGPRVVVLTGDPAGKAFCAGGDFGEMPSGDVKGDYAALLLAMTRSERPIVAKVNGAAMGGGLGLVAASTFAIAGDDAKLGTPEIDVGLFPFMIAAVLARLVPRRALLDMMLLGRRFGAEEARGLGLLNRVVPPGELDAAVADTANALAAKSPKAMALGLRAFADQDDLDLATALPMLRDRLGEALGTEDAREGLAAFLAKRPPVWTGR